MIFATLGSSKIAPMYAFAKKMEEIAASLSDEVIIQYGVTHIDFHYLKAIAYCDSRAMQNLLERAEIVICHGGWGSLSQCISMGKKLIAVPRKVGVEVNHDQEQLVRKLEALHCLIGVYDLANLAYAIEQARHFDFRPLIRGNATNILLQYLGNWHIL